ncbi:BPSL0761 family protein [Noviherbaspirillum pedocola]|uniref:Uncharacterized protein n=1 Tax=Noviherbaspirillum pedocola TaxID=2801341 RepID=A0A934SSB7_9BURK|nr:BPSL0761 family protein [Noviherbaspirillum pedocola]MBK4734692.1 hypothetical protein [Noviherbaspirillum pedocola]
MTTPEERTRAVLDARQLLVFLAYPAREEEVPESIRYQAETILRHYPEASDMDIAGLACPNLFSSERQTFTETKSKHRKRPIRTSPFLEKMVANAEPVLLGIGIAFVCIIIILFISLSRKLG